MSKLTVIACKCGAHYAAAIVPVSATFKTEMLAASKKGHTVAEMPLDGFAFGKCQCRKQKIVRLEKPLPTFAATPSKVELVKRALSDDNFNF